jgi:hypothetical protein
MMKSLLTAGRIRSIIAGAMTEKDVENSLRAHRIRYTYTTETGYLSIRIPTRSGCVRVYRSASRSAQFLVGGADRARAVGYPFPVPKFSWDD